MEPKLALAELTWKDCWETSNDIDALRQDIRKKENYQGEI